MQNLSVVSVLERLALVLETKTGNQLAERLGVSPQTISSWKSRESVPYAQCVDVAGEKGVSLDWLLTGEGPMHRGEAGQVERGAAESPREQALLALWRELDEDAQREIQRAAEEKKRLNTLEQRVSELEAVVAAGKRLA
ncbi:helix-turn-helix domain-containing protein [Ectopseudomonas oleovorans]|uniref:Helix-turn-helix domain-containing protein n=1 Tax=Ectopseudomonas oleovorans TaxID=301 RepID=A0AA42QDE5_ECTOL|nr:helix-turn-helix domain-containing protein [Pseudomonas oleovorans]MDH1341530.1 helix-turn-helix domain-containing protein [Pseudomonas oleovorans]MDH1492368.1 helix-turn-helix domain-containing protein [Pseudomonas oleovorans]